MSSRRDERLYGRENTYWWFVARRRLLFDLLRQHNHRRAPAEILDVGCDEGTNFAVLNQFGRTITANDSEQNLRHSAHRDIAPAVCSEPERLPFGDDRFDIVVALDVVQTAEHDVSCLAEIHRVLKPGGKIIVTVPAYGFLWSEHDEVLQHRRRYTSAQMRTKLARAGFELERATYFANLLFFPVALMRTAQNLFRRRMPPRTARIVPPHWLNALLVAWLDFERGLLRFLNLPFGLTVVCVATKSLAQRVEVPELALQAVRARARLVSPSSAFAKLD
jgi:SAM-dependent methyltransferase